MYRLDAPHPIKLNPRPAKETTAARIIMPLRFLRFGSARNSRSGSDAPLTLTTVRPTVVIIRDAVDPAAIA